MKKMIFCMMIATFFVTMTLTSGFAHWSDAYCDQLVSKRLLLAEDEMIKNPDAYATRGDMVRLIALLKDLSFSGEGQKFIDAAPEHPYYQYCQAAAEQGYVAGYPDGTYRPETTISRQEAFTIFGRVYNIAGDNSQTFTDSDKIEQYAKDYISGLKKLGIVNGYPDGTVQPDKEITNGEILTITYLLYETFDQSELPPPTPSELPSSSPTPTAQPSDSTGGNGSGDGCGGTPSPSPKGTVTLSQNSVTESISDISKDIKYSEIKLESTYPITKAEWVMMEDKTNNLEQAFQNLQEKATNITGNSFIAKKNGRYLIKITDEKHSTLYSFIDVTGIVPMSSLYEQYLKEEFSEEEQMPFIRLEPDIESKSTLVTIRDNYDSTLWVIKKQDLEEQGSVWETIALEKMVSEQPALVSDQGNYTVTLTENTDYWVVLQDKNGNFELKPFFLKMAYDMNLRATIAERNEDQPLAVTITAD